MRGGGPARLSHFWIRRINRKFGRLVHRREAVVGEIELESALVRRHCRRRRRRLGTLALGPFETLLARLGWQRECIQAVATPRLARIVRVITEHEQLELGLLPRLLGRLGLRQDRRSLVLPAALLALLRPARAHTGARDARTHRAGAALYGFGACAAFLLLLCCPLGKGLCKKGIARELCGHLVLICEFVNLRRASRRASRLS